MSSLATIDPVMEAIVSVGGRTTPTSLELPDGLKFNTWESVFVSLMRTQDTFFWWIADAAAYGDRWYRKDYGPALDRYSRETLWKMAWVARNVNPGVRLQGLSFWHHLEVAALDEDMQRAFLADAFEDQWSAKTLRERVSEFRGRNSVPSLPALSIKAPADYAERIRIVAERLEVDPAQWIWELCSPVIDKALSEALTLEIA